MTSAKSPDGLAGRAELRAVGVDDWSAVRWLHAASFERLTGPRLDAEAVEAVRRLIGDLAYIDRLQRRALHGAWIDGVLVGTCGWLPSDDSGHSARITSVFVSPMFARQRLGTRLVRDAEARAGAAGFSTFTTRATEVTVPFFQRLGYEVTSHGISMRAGELPLPVTFLRRSEPIRAGTTATADQVTPAVTGRGTRLALSLPGG